MDTLKENKSSEKIYIHHLLLLIWSKIVIIAIFSLLLGSLSFLYSINLPNIYSSHTLLKPSSEENNLSSRLQSLSSIASIAGANIPSKQSSKSDEAIERIKSFDFFSTNFLPRIKLQNIYAVKKWVSLDNTISYKTSLFDPKVGSWTRKVKAPRQPKPSAQEAYEVYKKLLKISKNEDTGFVYISITHQSPHIAKSWLDIIIDEINSSMREIDMEISQNYINFLNEEYKNTNLQPVQDSIVELLSSQIKTLMVASSNDNYTFEIIEKPIASERKVGPNRLVIILIGLFIGAFAVIIYIVITAYLRFNDETIPHKSYQN